MVQMNDFSFVLWNLSPWFVGEAGSGLDAYYTNQKSGTPHCVECRTLLEKSGGYLLSRWTQYHRRGRA